MTKSRIKDQVEGNELDLSLNELSEVPVQELAEITKATHLDLSCNKITRLPDNFSSLTHLMKLDLSKNQLKELPYNFGNLVHLQFLDLYGNQLEMLPISFCRLKNLKWMDLKDNPLKSELKSIAGDCLDSQQCKKCATDVVKFMQSVESEFERQKQKKLKEEREKEAARKAKEQKQLEEQKRLKKAEKERRKAETRARKAEMEAEAKKPSQETSTLPHKLKSKSEHNNHTSLKSEENPSKSRHWCTKLLSFLFIMPVFLLVSLVSLRTYNRSEWSVNALLLSFDEVNLELQEAIQLWWHGFARPYLSNVLMTFQEWKQKIIT